MNAGDAFPAALGTAVATPAGELLLVPAELNAAIAAALRDSAGDTESAVAWRTAFGAAFVLGLQREGLILVPRARSNTREAVNADLYSLALSMKRAAEMQVHALKRVLGPLDGLGSFAHHLQAVVDALTGHAPPGRAQALTAALDERVRALRLLAFDTPLDAPLADPPPAIDPDKEAAARILAEAHGLVAPQGDVTGGAA